jgi:predicted hotdog family 3-hydroxylacyl-ACP dehydratase
MNIPAENLIPHRPPMCFIHALTHCDDASTHATARFNADDFAVSNHLVLEAALVECVAQTIAASLAHSCRGDNPPALGMLAAVTDFQILARPAAGENLKIEVRERKRLGPMRLVSGMIICEGQLIASGELTVYA